jgi:hypothetical protein
MLSAGVAFSQQFWRLRHIWSRKNDAGRHGADGLGRIKRVRKNTHYTVPKWLREKGRSGNAAAFRRIGGVGGQLVLFATIG